jgi:hypothetical protein
LLLHLITPLIIVSRKVGDHCACYSGWGTRRKEILARPRCRWQSNINIGLKEIGLVQVAVCCKDCGELAGLTEEVLVSPEGLSAMELDSLKSYNC